MAEWEKIAAGQADGGVVPAKGARGARGRKRRTDAATAEPAVGGGPPAIAVPAVAAAAVKRRLRCKTPDPMPMHERPAAAGHFDVDAETGTAPAHVAAAPAKKKMKRPAAHGEAAAAISEVPADVMAHAVAWEDRFADKSKKFFTDRAWTRGKTAGVRHGLQLSDAHLWGRLCMREAAAKWEASQVEA